MSISHAIERGTVIFSNPGSNNLPLERASGQIDRM